MSITIKNISDSIAKIKNVGKEILVNIGEELTFNCCVGVHSSEANKIAIKREGVFKNIIN